MAFDAIQQRQIMGRFATGVTIITTRFGEEISGMTANAVISLSLDPPLVAVSVDKTSTMHHCLTTGQCFAINVLNSEQEALSNRFAQRGPKDFSDLDLTSSATGAPILTAALAYLDCKLVDITAVGDHDLFIGEPVAGSVGEGAPLLYYGGRYGEMKIAEVREDRQ